MKLLILSLLLLTSCASQYVIEEEPCHAIIGREQDSVCGADRVRTHCVPYPDKDVSTCKKL